VSALLDGRPGVLGLLLGVGVRQVLHELDHDIDLAGLATAELVDLVDRQRNAQLGRNRLNAGVLQDAVNLLGDPHANDLGVNASALKVLPDLVRVLHIKRGRGDVQITGQVLAHDLEGADGHLTAEEGRALGLGGVALSHG